MNDSQRTEVAGFAELLRPVADICAQIDSKIAEIIAAGAEFAVGQRILCMERELTVTGYRVTGHRFYYTATSSDGHQGAVHSSIARPAAGEALVRNACDLTGLMAELAELELELARRTGDASARAELVLAALAPLPEHCYALYRNGATLTLGRVIDQRTAFAMADWDESRALVDSYRTMGVDELAAALLAGRTFTLVLPDGDELRTDDCTLVTGRPAPADAGRLLVAAIARESRDEALARVSDGTAEYEAGVACMSGKGVMEAYGLELATLREAGELMDQVAGLEEAVERYLERLDRHEAPAQPGQTVFRRSSGTLHVVTGFSGHGALEIDGEPVHFSQFPENWTLAAGETAAPGPHAGPCPEADRHQELRMEARKLLRASCSGVSFAAFHPAEGLVLVERVGLKDALLLDRLAGCSSDEERLAVFLSAATIHIRSRFTGEMIALPAEQLVPFPVWGAAPAAKWCRLLADMLREGRVPAGLALPARLLLAAYGEGV